MPVHVLKPTSKVLYTSNFVLIGSNKGRKYSIDESKFTNVLNLIVEQKIWC